MQNQRARMWAWLGVYWLEFLSEICGVVTKIGVTFPTPLHTSSNINTTILHLPAANAVTPLARQARISSDQIRFGQHP